MIGIKHLTDYIGYKIMLLQIKKIRLMTLPRQPLLIIAIIESLISAVALRYATLKYVSG